LGNGKVSKNGTQPASTKGKGEVLTKEMLVRDMMKIERERIASQDKKTETNRMLIRAQDDADKRQFRFHMKSLEYDNTRKIERHRLVTILSLGGGATLLAIFLLLLSFAFWGDTEQSEIAILALKIIMTGAGGYGVIATLISAIKKLSNNTDQ
jgi:stress-induced morphogen